MSLEDRLYPLLSAYERLPSGLKWVIGASYRQLPRGWRYGAHFETFRRLTAEGESWTRERIQEYQWDQLQLTLRHAAEHVPFYQRAFHQAGFDPGAMCSAADLTGCPLLEKRHVQEHLPEMLSNAWPAEARLHMTTGGSTGVPVGFCLHKGISRSKEQAFLDAMWRRAGYEEGDRLAVIRGHVTSDRARGRVTSHDPTWDWLMLSSYHLTRERWPEYIEALEKFKPDILHAYPSAALQLAECLEAAKQSWTLPLKCVLCGSERLTLPQKKLLERVFKTRVYRWYGHSERVVLAGEGRGSDWFYFWPQYGFAEFGPPDAEGSREVIGTSFHNLVMPLIRYRTGDYVRLVEGTEAEMRKEFPWAAAVEVAGREQEFLISATGRRISLTAFNMHDAIFNDLYAVQFFQEEPGVAELRFVPSPAFQRARLLEIEKGIRRKLGDDFRVTLREVDETEKTDRGKHRWLVSRLGAERSPSAEKFR